MDTNPLVDGRLAVSDCSQVTDGATVVVLASEKYVKEHTIKNAFDGTKPINPSGGLIGCGYPVGASGARMFLDLYKQVAGKAKGYQLKKANNGMMLNIGGSATTNYVFIVGNE
nr:hypothetical protein [Holdemania massiliensis]